MTMIAEPEILSPSSWNSDGYIPSDFKSYLNSGEFELGFPSLDLVDYNRNQRFDREDFSSSCSPSSASSECSEEFIFNSNCKSRSTSHISDHDYLSTTLNLLDDNSIPFFSEDYDWTTDTFASGIDNLLPSDSIFEGDCEHEEVEIPAVSSPSLKPKRPSDPVADNTSWSSMGVNEQLTAIENLTKVISNQLGLREQLDIIRIIQPSATVSPHDKEFTIDLSLLNDQKLSRVRDYMRKLQANQRHSKQGNRKHNNNNCGESTCKSGYTSSGHSKCEVTKHKGKNAPKALKEVKERRPSLKVIKQRQDKEHRQILKERRSGLFVREEVLSLSTQLITMDDDSDIDIME